MFFGDAEGEKVRRKILRSHSAAPIDIIESERGKGTRTSWARGGKKKKAILLSIKKDTFFPGPVDRVDQEKKEPLWGGHRRALEPFFYLVKRYFGRKKNSHS